MTSSNPAHSASPNSNPPRSPSPFSNPPRASDQENPTPQDAETSPSTSPIRRSHSTKSVQFSTSPDRTDMANSEEEISPGGGSRRRISAQAESSGDEITPLAQRERGSARGRNYDGTSINSKGDDAGGGAGATRERTGSGDGGVRRRRSERGRERRDRDGEYEEEEEGWWARLVEKFGSVELDNKGSVARDHLALERTFLAWLRTSLSFAGIGIAITQLFRLNTTITEREGYHPSNPNTFHLRQLGKPLGATFLGIAILVLLVGGRRYAESQYWIIRGKFPASRGSVFLVTGITVALIVTSLVVVLTVAPGAFEKR